MVAFWTMLSMMMPGSRLACRHQCTTTPLPASSFFTSRKLQLVRAASKTTPPASNGESAPNRQTRLPQKISVGIFVDLDNAAPREHTREALSRFIKSLRYFGKETIHGKVVRLHGWGNSATHKFGAEIDEVATASTFQPWDGQSAVSGYDETSTLRCGVCGRQIKLSKKDRLRKGMTVEKKLVKHMKELHAREQTKRLNNMKRKKGKLSEKDRERVKKFNSAAVGVMKTKAANNLFQILKEQGMQCKVVSDADAALISAAALWMKEVKSQRNVNNSTTAGPSPATTTNVDKEAVNAALVVVSRDSDFVPTLKNARKNGILAVSVSANSVNQTKALVQVSDIVLEAAQSSSSSQDRQDDDDLYDDANHVSLMEDENADPMASVFKATSRTERGDAALQRGYTKKLSNVLKISQDHHAA